MEYLAILLPIAAMIGMIWWNTRDSGTPDLSAVGAASSKVYFRRGVKAARAEADEQFADEVATEIRTDILGRLKGQGPQSPTPAANAASQPLK